MAAAPTDITTPLAHGATPGAPALIVVAVDGNDLRSVHTVRSLTDTITALRPGLAVEPAFLGAGRHGLEAAVGRLAADGHREAVVVPLLLTEAGPHTTDVQEAVSAAAARHGAVRLELTRVLGIEAALFRVLDQRLRETLAQHRVRQLDALVLAGPGSADPVANAAIARAARTWGKHHHLPTIAAFASSAPPAAGEAVRAHRADGRRHIAVGMAFFTPGPQADRVRELALEAGAVAVAEPLGAHDEIARSLLARYAVGAVDLVPLDLMAV